MDVTDTVDIWASCPDCGKSLTFYNKQVTQQTHGFASCVCGVWEIELIVEITKVGERNEGQ